MKVKITRRRLVRAAGIGVGIVALLFLLTPTPRFAEDYGALVLDRSGRPLSVFLAPDQQWRLPVDSLPEKYRRALLLYEDRRFYLHPGVDPLSLAHAVFQCLGAGRYVRGASTIPMQIARLSQPKERTLLNKGLEIVQALKLSLLLSKREVLHLYASRAPMGGNTVGLEAACLRWLGKSPGMISWSEAALLAVLPNSPSLIHLDRQREALRDKRDRLLHKLHAAGALDRDDLAEALAEPLPGESQPMPFEAPQACRWLLETHPEPVIRSSLDLLLQREVQAALRDHMQALGRFGITNAAALVTETATGRVLAYVGSADFFSTQDQGQVDGVRAARSTGSLLKPFLYGALFDRGDILPQSLIKDVPAFFGSFVPVNAGNEYSGMVPAGQALLRSLNVPAVMMLQQYGIGEFQDLLQQAGMSTLFRSPDDYGLTLILGGAEGTLWEMCGLYRMLGRGGFRSPLSLSPEGADSTEKQPRILSAGACWQVLEILKDLHRPDNEYYWRQFENQRLVAWKTGTSFGQRDAWAIGVSPRWTVGVWVGNFDGLGNPELGGARSAGPLLFKILARLPRAGALEWFTRPEYDLRRVKICSATGFPASSRCPRTEWAEMPAGASPGRMCPYHIVCRLDSAGDQTCSLCWGSGPLRTDTLLIFQPDAAEYLRKHGYRADELPRHRQSCPTQAGENPLQIVYPPSGSGIWIPRGSGGEPQKVVLKAAHSNSTATVHWYVDGRYLGATGGLHELAVFLPRGEHRLTLVDLEGHRRTVTFTAAQRTGPDTVVGAGPD